MHVKGRLLRRRLDVGSKSERWGYVIETPDGAQLAVERKDDDNPFDQRALEPLADHSVEVRGVMYRGRLLADTIVSLD